MSLLGLAGSSAASIGGWLAPLFIGLSLVTLARAHYVLYWLKRGNRASHWITWTVTVLILGYWTCYAWTGLTLIPNWQG